jgi:hypothetical protein
VGVARTGDSTNVTPSSVARLSSGNDVCTAVYKGSASAVPPPRQLCLEKSRIEESKIGRFCLYGATGLLL